MNYNLFEQTQDVSALNEAIACERSATDAWRQIVSGRKDVYADDLMMGVRVAELCGNWKNELDSLEKGLAKLEQKMQGIQGNRYSKAGSKIPGCTDLNADKLFNIGPQSITNAPAGQPVTIK